MPTTTATKTATGERPIVEFLNLLLKEGFIRQEDLAQLKAKYSTPEDLFEALNSFASIVPNDKLTELYARAIGIPYVKLSSVDPRALQIIDKNVASRFGFVPYAIDEKNKVVSVAIASPVRLRSLNQAEIKNLQARLGYQFDFAMTSQDDLNRALSGKPAPAASPTSHQKTSFEKIEKVDLSRFKIPSEVLRKMPYDLARRFGAVIFRQEKDKVFDVASYNPTNPRLHQILDFVQQEAGITLRLYSAEKEDVERALDSYGKLLGQPEVQTEAEKELAAQAKDAQRNETIKTNLDLLKEGKLPGGEVNLAGIPKDVVSATENPELTQLLGKETITTADIRQYTKANQIPQLVAAILQMAILAEASDVHIEPYEKAIRLRYRIDGVLKDIILLPIGMNPSIVARVKILSKLKLDEQRVPQDGRFEVRVNRAAIDIRVSTLPTVFGEKVVMRLLVKSRKLGDLEELGLGGLAYDRVIKAISKPYGVVLATGPTGSGKSTTLYSILYRLNRPEVNIVTLEDPVEYEIQGVNQVQIKPQIGFTFANGLRSILRQDPNIIMVGEIRDTETAELVTHAALTGHLVLSTLHTNDASSALPRLINLEVEPFLVTSAVNAIIGQRLVRRICPKCRVEIQVPQTVIQKVKKEFEKLNLTEPIKFFKGRGCESCTNGFKGRIGIFEVLDMSPTIEDLVLARKSANDIFTQSVKEGMITMEQDGFIKTVKGLTTVDEVLRVTSETKEG